MTPSRMESAGAAGKAAKRSTTRAAEARRRMGGQASTARCDGSKPFPPDEVRGNAREREAQPDDAVQRIGHEGRDHHRAANRDESDRRGGVATHRVGAPPPAECPAATPRESRGK